MSRKRVQGKFTFLFWFIFSGFYVELVRAKIKAQGTGNLKEEAHVCGELGEQYTEEGGRLKLIPLYLKPLIR